MADPRFSQVRTSLCGALLLGRRPSHVGHQSAVGYSYPSVPSLSGFQDQDLKWKGFRLGMENLDFALTAYEVDLMAVLTACVFPARLVCSEFDFF